MPNRICSRSRRITRRTFLGTGAATLMATGVGQAAAGDSGKTKAVRATEGNGTRADRPSVRVAVMGVNGRGRRLLSAFQQFPEVSITHICDPDATVIPPAIKSAVSGGGKEPAAVRDFRKILDDPQVDVLVCAAPDHWHALATILACQAGKDVYVEKPVSHNVVEGRRMVAAARKHGRIVQAGTQRRSSEEIALAVKRVQSGRLGKVHLVRGWITSIRPNIGHVPVSAPPPSLDFDLWAGPAVNPHYQQNLVHYHWHWRWLYGTGECGNNGIHFLDVARWGLGVDAPQYISCGGNKYSFDDDQETPDTQLATFDFAGATVEWEHRTWSKRGLEGGDYGIVFYGTKATLVAAGSGWKIYEDKKVVEQHGGTGVAEWERRHIQNFLNCRRTRERPAADIEIGHRSTMLCHLANIAWRTRSTLKFDGATETITNNPAASALLAREYRHGFELPNL